MNTVNGIQDQIAFSVKCEAQWRRECGSKATGDIERAKVGEEALGSQIR